MSELDEPQMSDDAFAASHKHADNQSLTTTAAHSNGVLENSQPAVGADDASNGDEDWGDFTAPPTAKPSDTGALAPTSPTPAPLASSTDAPLLTTLPATIDDDFAGFDDFTSATTAQPIALTSSAVSARLLLWTTSRSVHPFCLPLALYLRLCRVMPSKLRQMTT